MQEPQPRLIRSWDEAEAVACEWMRYLGFADACLTAAGADGGIDIDSGAAVAQVKAEMKGKIGRPLVQALAGIGAAERKRCVFFSLSGFTDDAVEWAARVEMALFHFDLSGTPVPLNEAASHLLDGARRSKVSALSLPPPPSQSGGMWNGCNAFYGVVLGVSKTAQAPPGLDVALVVRTARNVSELGLPQVEWMSEIAWTLRRFPYIQTPYVMDTRFYAGCVVRAPLGAIHGLADAWRAGRTLGWIESARGWFFTAGSGSLEFALANDRS